MPQPRAGLPNDTYPAKNPNPVHFEKRTFQIFYKPIHSASGQSALGNVAHENWCEHIKILKNAKSKSR